MILVDMKIKRFDNDEYQIKLKQEYVLIMHKTFEAFQSKYL